ncbi:MAG: hypothetical protein JETCAE03_24280 [Ignavibacteriaceae bacterium]|nr:hypothetical protein [Ignavibacteriaceae bacterium]GIK60681.1 MAG: hypothetical protein BroJett017_15710 [Ignavibacteriota bacterium]GJQ42930.1 MAG: hypothetical protein JETCAE03_24280 [Ignavibacteriaceae bacterium]
MLISFAEVIKSDEIIFRKTKYAGNPIVQNAVKLPYEFIYEPVSYKRLALSI